MRPHLARAQTVHIRLGRRSGRLVRHLYSTTAPATALIVAKNSRLRRPKDLEGTTMGVVGLASVSSLAVREWMRQSEIDLDTIKLIELGFPEMAPAVMRGTVSSANTHHAETAVIIAKYNKIELARVRAMTRCIYATSLDAGLMQPMLDVAYRFKQLEKPVDANAIFARV